MQHLEEGEDEIQPGPVIMVDNVDSPLRVGTPEKEVTLKVVGKE